MSFQSQPEMFPQIHFSHIFIINDFIGSAVSQHRTIIYDVSTIAYTQRFSYIMVCDQHTDLTLPEKMDDFLYVQHGNGIALVPERTSTGWWQEAASRSDLLLFVKQRIPFISSTRDDTTACAIGSTLIAIGERGTRGLITASRNELGLLLKPYKG